MEKVNYTIEDDFKDGGTGFQLSPDEKYLLGCNIRKSRLQIYEFCTGKLLAIAPFQSNSQAVVCSKFTPRGKIAIVFNTGEVELLEINEIDLSIPIAYEDYIPH